MEYPPSYNVFLLTLNARDLPRFLVTSFSATLAVPPSLLAYPSKTCAFLGEINSSVAALFHQLCGREVSFELQRQKSLPSSQPLEELWLGLWLQFVLSLKVADAAVSALQCTSILHFFP